MAYKFIDVEYDRVTPEMEVRLLDDGYDLWVMDVRDGIDWVIWYKPKQGHETTPPF